MQSDSRLSAALGLSLSLVSAAALAYEILLTRLFSIIQWHHFAYMMISVALLGYGAAGSVVTLYRDRIEKRFVEFFAGAATCFGFAALACFLMAQTVPFNALELLWDGTQVLWMLEIYILLFVPFFFAALCVCLTFSRFSAQAHWVYSYDILGAAAGSIGVILALYAMPPMTVLGAIAAIGLLAAALAWIADGGKRPIIAVLPIALAIGAMLAAQSPLAQMRMSQYKSLSQMLTVMGVHVLDERSSPLGLITVVESPEVPLRHAPGMSLNAPGEPPPQLGIFTDGEGLSALIRFDGRREPLAYLDYLTSALPYHLTTAPRVLVLGAGPGSDVLQALYHKAARIDAVELNPQMIQIVEQQFPEFSGRPYSQPGVEIHLGEARGFAAATQQRYDVIQLALLDAFGASTAGLYALSESYIYTVEALQRYMERLAPGGYLSITRWATLPPRDTLRLFATAVRALEQQGVTDPGLRLALIRSWKTATLVIKNGDLSIADISRLKEFCVSRSFDLAWYPGMQETEAQRYNLLDRSYFYEGAVALLGPERDSFIERYKFNIAPASDDRPYFFQFFRWKSLPELLSLRERGGLPLLDWGYPLLVAGGVQALILSAVLIVLPLWLRRSPTFKATGADLKVRSACYFAALGMAFLFVEIAFIQKFILFLSHPLYAIAVVLFAFLFAAGLGGALSAKLARAVTPRVPAVAWPVAGIALLSTIYLVFLPPAFASLMYLPDAARIAISVLLIAPLGVCMGMPFPLGLLALSAHAPPLVPWGWAINACVSVVSAILATLLAIHFGFTAVLASAVVLYLLAAISFPSAKLS